MDKKSHTVRLCLESEYEKLIDFLKNQWSENHIFVKSKKMLDFQHLNLENKVYNFVVAYNEQTENFDAVLGFIPLSRYDKNLNHNDFWLALWKVKEEYKKYGIGLELLFYFNRTFEPHSLSAVGISDVAKRIYRAFRYNIGVLEHFYIKNPHCENFKIADFKQNCTKFKSEDVKLKPVDITKLKDSFVKFHPQKSINFLINRYIKHPIYHYEIYGIFKKNLLVSLCVFRKIEANGGICLRIVDWLGDFVPNCYYAFLDLLLEFNAEYIDLLCLGSKEKILKMGFCLKGVDELIPNYFEPFLKQNVSIEYAYKSKQDFYTIFKGDSDQDRPSMISHRGGASK